MEEGVLQAEAHMKQDLPPIPENYKIYNYKCLHIIEYNFREKNLLISHDLSRNSLKHLKVLVNCQFKFYMLKRHFNDFRKTVTWQAYKASYCLSSDKINRYTCCRILLIPCGWIHPCLSSLYTEQLASDQETSDDYPAETPSQLLFLERKGKWNYINL